MALQTLQVFLRRRTVLASVLIAVSALGLFLGCAGPPRRPAAIFESPSGDDVARLRAIDGEFRLALERAGPGTEPWFVIQALPEVSSLSHSAPLAAASVAGVGIHAATDTWASLVFERSRTANGDIIELRARRPSTDLAVRYHVPRRQRALGIDVECLPSIGAETCTATHTIDIPALDANYRFWAAVGADESPVAIPVSQEAIASVTEPHRLVSLSAKNEDEHGVVARHIHIRPVENRLRIDVVTTLHTRSRRAARYRMVLTWDTPDEVITETDWPPD